MEDPTQYKNQLEKFEPVSLTKLNQLKLLSRMDSKYVMPIDKLRVLLDKASDFYKVLEINDQRSFYYKTVYFDSPDLSLYINHQNRRSNRYKIRERHYYVNDQSFLEVKRKNNKGKTIKSRMKLDGFQPLTNEYYDFIESHIDLKERNLIESSTNAFNRITLASFESNERITIDYNFIFESNDNSENINYFAIVELKREKSKNNSPITEILHELKVYPKGFSKYCMGLAILNPKLKQNTFKKNILYLNKLKRNDNNND